MACSRDVFLNETSNTPNNYLKRNRENDASPNSDFQSPPDKFQSISSSPLGPAPPSASQPLSMADTPYYSPDHVVTFTSLDSGTLIPSPHPVNSNSQSTKPPDRTTSNSDTSVCPAWAVKFMSELTSQYKVLQASVTSAVKTTDTNLERLIKNVSQMQSSLQSVTNRVIKLETDVKRINTQTARIDRIDKSTNALTKQNDETRKNVSLHEGNIRNINTQTSEIEKQLEYLQERIVSQEERSMRDNLLFFGIPEEEKENTEALLCTFIKNKLPSVHGIFPISFERVHRFGKQRHGPKPIVAKFSFHKDREAVRRSGRDLKGSPQFSIREQYPHEIYQRRQKLQPKFKEARSKNLRASLHLDSLQVENTEYRVNKKGLVYQVNSHHSSSSEASYSDVTRQQKQQQQQQQKQQHFSDRHNSAIPLHNRFDALRDQPVQGLSHHQQYNNAQRRDCGPPPVSGFQQSVDRYSTV